MRCHPGVSYPLERIVPKGGTELCGVHLREGTVVGINPAVIHRDQSIFGEDASEFNPERWLGLDEEARKTMDRHLMTVSHSLLPGYDSKPVSQPQPLTLYTSLDTVLAPVWAKTFPSWKWASWSLRCCAHLISSGRLRILHGGFTLFGSRVKRV